MITSESILEFIHEVIDSRNFCQSLIDGINDDINDEWEVAMDNGTVPDIARLRYHLRRYEARLETYDNALERLLSSLHPEHRSMLNALGVS